MLKIKEITDENKRLQEWLNDQNGVDRGLEPTER